MRIVDRFWLLTWTTYGTWLPGDRRGSVANVPDKDGNRHRHNRVGTPYAQSQPRLIKHVEQTLTQEAVWLTVVHAQAVVDQVQETSRIRQWKLCAAAVMSNHVHVVLGVPGDPDPEKLLGDLKAYATRRLNQFRRRRWWTDSGSRRKLPNRSAVNAAVRYVASQRGCLALYVDEAFARDAGIELGLNE